MKRYQWWTIFGLGGASVTAALLGQTVMGQPGPKGSAPLDAPIVIPQPEPERKLPSRPLALPMPLVEQAQELPLGKLPNLLPIPNMKPESGPSFDTQVPPTIPGKKLQLLAPIGSADNGGIVLTQGSTPVAAPMGTSPRAAADASLDVQPGRQQPSITVEWVGPSAIRINQPMACQILVRNTATTAAHNVVVKHRLAKDVTCKSTEPSATTEAGELSWNLGTIAPNQSRRLDVALVSKSRGPLTCHATVTFTSVAAHQVQVREPLLSVKIRSPEKVVVGEYVTLLFALSNPGDGITESVRVKTILPDGIEHPSGKKIIEFDVGNLAPKEIRTLQLVCVAKGGGEQKFAATAIGDGEIVANDTTTFEVLVPKLDVAISGPKLRYLDRHAIYVLKITNPGTAIANTVELNELVPAGFKFHQANQGGLYHEASRVISWKLGDLQPGQSKEVAIDLIATEPGEHRLVAQVRGARGLKSDTDARTIVEGLPSLLIEVGHLDDPLEVGAETAYEIRVANTGTKTETNVEVVCTLPDQLQFKGAKCSATLRFRQEGNDLIFEPLPRLAPKADVIYRVHVRGIAPGDIRFRTRIKSDGLRDPVVREENTRIYNDDTPVRPASNVVPTLPPAVRPAPITKDPVLLPMAPPKLSPNTSTPLLPPPSLPEEGVKVPVSLLIAPKLDSAPIAPPTGLPNTGKQSVTPLTPPLTLPALPTVGAPAKIADDFPAPKLVPPPAVKTPAAIAPPPVPVPAPMPAVVSSMLPYDLPLPAPKE